MVKKEYSILFYFLDDSNTAQYITDSSDDIQSSSFDDLMGNNLYQKVNLGIFVGYDKTIDELKQFKIDYLEWCDEIQNRHCFTIKDKKFRIKMNTYKSIQHATYELFKNFCPVKDLKQLIEPVDFTEYMIHQQCLRSGLITLDNKYRETTQDIYGYDFSSEYPNFLCNLVFPKCSGYKSIIKEINWSKLEYGIYRVKITCTNTSFQKIFNFSKNNHYTSRQLKDLFKHKETYDIHFELLQPDDDYSYNAYIYKDDEFILGHELFSVWLENMTALKKKCSKSNQLIKLLITSLWGLLCETKKIRIDATNENILSKYDLEDEYYWKETIDDKHILIKTDDIYTYGGFGRMKVFLTTNCRMFIFNYCIKNNCVDNVVRIHTDGLMFNKQMHFKEKLNKGIVPIPENKSTGLIKLYNPMRYFHVCQCGFEYKYNHKKENIHRIKPTYDFVKCLCGHEYLHDK